MRVGSRGLGNGKWRRQVMFASEGAEIFQRTHTRGCRRSVGSGEMGTKAGLKAKGRNGNDRR